MEPVTDGAQSLSALENQRGNPTGFSLLELLVVIALISILLMLVMPAVSVVDGTKLTQSGQIVLDQISLARQIASSRNRNVEVRLIQLDAQGRGYGAIQLWAAASPQSTPQPLRRMESLPSETVISKDATLLSRVLQSATTGTMPANIPAANAPYAVFDISPTGLVGSGNKPLVDNGDVYLTVIPVRYASAATPPANFVTVQINPLTGTPRIYRP